MKLLADLNNAKRAILKHVGVPKFLGLHMEFIDASDAYWSVNMADGEILYADSARELQNLGSCIDDISALFRGEQLVAVITVEPRVMLFDPSKEVPE